MPGGRKPSAAVAVKTDVPVPFLCHFKTRASHRSLNGSVESLTTFCRCELGFAGLVVPYAVDEAAEPEATQAPPANQRPGCEGGRRQCCFHFFFFFFSLFYSFVFRFILESTPTFLGSVPESQPTIHWSSAESRHDSQLHFYCFVVVGFFCYCCCCPLKLCIVTYQGLIAQKNNKPTTTVSV